MPTVLSWRGWTFFFYYSADRTEPPHIHVRKGRQEAKFWLQDCSVAHARRMPHHEINLLQDQVRRHRDVFLAKWHEHLR